MSCESCCQIIAIVDTLYCSIRGQGVHSELVRGQPPSPLLQHNNARLAQRCTFCGQPPLPCYSITQYHLISSWGPLVPWSLSECQAGPRCSCPGYLPATSACTRSCRLPACEGSLQTAWRPRTSRGSYLRLWGRGKGRNYHLDMTTTKQTGTWGFP